MSFLGLPALVILLLIATSGSDMGFKEISHHMGGSGDADCVLALRHSLLGVLYVDGQS